MMHILGKPLSRSAALAVACMMFGMFDPLARTALADTLPLVFEPPVIERENICAPDLTVEQVAADWADWDGTTLPDREPQLIRRELRRLMDDDAVRWFDMIEKAYALMPEVDSQFGPEKALLLRIELLIAAGRLKELTSQRLVEQLLDSNSGGSPKVQNILSEYLIKGIGIPKDPTRGLQLLVAAGYGGNADALLKIVEMEQKGEAVPGWDVPQDIAVTMAFGALVGKLDPLICDRVARVAREYVNGTVITRDITLAEKWFRFAADMGSSASAWKVAEMHMQSEDLKKSNDVLIEYLTKAADGGLSYAQTSLGRIYEIGALVPRDLEKAERLYAAAALGDRGGAVRYTLFLQAAAKDDPRKFPAYRAALADLVARDDAPDWAVVAMADLIMEEKGRWAGEAETVALLEKTKTSGGFAVSKWLTPIRFRYAKTPEEFYQIIDDVIESVHLGGEIDPMNGLKSAFTCRAPNAPQREEAIYWGEVSAATATKTVEFSPAELKSLIANPDVDSMAILQSQALLGRQTATAQFMAVLDRSGAPESTRQFWADYAARSAGTETSRGRLEAKFAQTGENIGDPADYLRRAMAAGDAMAGIDLAQYLMELDPEAHAKEAYAAIKPLLAKGNGNAMRLLPLLDSATYPDDRAVYEAFAEVIDARGDFDALILALPHLADPARIADYKARVTTVTDCDFNQVRQIAETMGEIKDKAGFAHWMEIAEFLTDNDSWRLVQLGDLLLRYGDETTANARLAFYQRGFEAGNVTAIYRLLNEVSQPDNPAYDPARSADLFVELVKLSDLEDLPRVLNKLAAAPLAIKDVVYGRIDLPKLYLTAAEAGVPAAMREYGKILTANATAPEDLVLATGWFAQAAKAGDMAAMVYYADALAFGIGVEPSREEALVWLDKAARAGHVEAAAKMHSLSLEVRASQ